MNIRLFALAALAFSAAPADAQGAKTKVPLFGRTLSFQLPAGMVVANNKRNDTHVLIEYVPKGETLGNWTRLVTVQAYRGLGAAQETTSSIARRAFDPSACKIGPIYRDGGEHRMTAEVTRSIIANGCASLPKGAYPKALAGAGEQDFIYVFRDRETIYTLNYAVRGPTFNGKAPPVAVDGGEALLRQIFGSVLL